MFNFLKKGNLVITVVIFCFLLGLNGFVYAQSAGGGGGGSAGGAGGSGGGGSEDPFGGKRSITIYCTCNDNSSDALVFLKEYIKDEDIKLLKTSQSKIFETNNINGTFFLGSKKSTEEKCKIRIYQKICAEIKPDAELGSKPGTGTSDAND